VERLRKRKVGKLLDILPRRGPVAFQHFINGLMKDDQECVAECLDPDLVAQWNSVHPKLKPGSHNPYPGQQPLPVPQSHQSFQPKSFFESEGLEYCFVFDEFHFNIHTYLKYDMSTSLFTIAQIIF